MFLCFKENMLALFTEEILNGKLHFLRSDLTLTFFKKISALLGLNYQNSSPKHIVTSVTIRDTMNH